MLNLGFVIAVVLLVLFLFAISKKSKNNQPAEGCCGMPATGVEGFALDLSPRGGYPNCKGCVIDPVSFGEPEPGNIWNNEQGMGISPTMSGTVFRDWQTIHGNNMNRAVHSNNLALEEGKSHEQPLWKNPYNYPAYAVSASSLMLPLEIKPSEMTGGVACSSCNPTRTGESFYHLFGTMHGDL